MLFTSVEFLVLVLCTFALYYLPFLRQWQVHVLIASSLVFYAWTNWQLLLLFIASVIVNVTASYLVTHGPPAKHRLYATVGVVVNLTILAFFKYSPLIGGTLFPETSDMGLFLATIPLPIGISFYTFEGISLLVDAYKGNTEEKYRALVPKSLPRHIINTTFFVAFFPHLIAGPILKAHDFIPQIVPKHFADLNWGAAFRACVVGYFLKMVLADNLKDHTFWIAYPYYESQSTAVLATMLFGYSMQIFADFAGYSLIAIGIAYLFGYRLPDNFNFPYISLSITEFWRRWHISLSSFLREYLYIPLGGNRKGNVRTYINLMAVMFFGGLWHGAAWSYAVWGSFHGIALALERFFKPHFPNPTTALSKGFCMLITFFFVSFAWLLFKLPDFSQAVGYVQSMGANTQVEVGTIGLVTIACIAIYSVPVILYHIWYLISQHGQAQTIRRFSWLGYAVMLFLLFVNAGQGGDFIYFQF